MNQYDKKLDRLELKIDDIGDHLGSIDITLKAQHISLKEHIRRTSLLEEAMHPIQRHINRVQGAVMFIMGVGAIWAVVEFIIKR